mgnify:CR=1 FL=1
MPINSSRTLTQEGKGHGRGRAAENQGPKKTRGGKKIQEWSAEVQEPNGNIWKGQQPNADRTPRSDTGRKPLIPIGRKGNTHTTTTTQHNTTKQTTTRTRTTSESAETFFFLYMSEEEERRLLRHPGSMGFMP